MPVNYQQAGLSCLTFDPEEVNATTAVTAATLYLNRVSFESGGSLLPPNIYAGVTTAGTGSAGGSFLAVYNCSVLATPEIGALSPIAAGTRLAITAELGLLAAGWVANALTWLPGLGELPPGEYWLAAVFNNGTTQPAIANAGLAANVALPNLGLTGAALRYATLGATAAATIVAANAISTNAKPLLMGLSA